MNKIRLSTDLFNNLISFCYIIVFTQSDGSGISEVLRNEVAQNLGEQSEPDMLCYTPFCHYSLSSFLKSNNFGDLNSIRTSLIRLSANFA